MTDDKTVRVSDVRELFDNWCRGIIATTYAPTPSSRSKFRERLAALPSVEESQLEALDKIIGPQGYPDMPLVERAVLMRKQMDADEARVQGWQAEVEAARLRVKELNDHRTLWAIDALWTPSEQAKQILHLRQLPDVQMMFDLQAEVARLTPLPSRCAGCAFWTVKIEGLINRGCNHPNRPLDVMPTPADYCCNLFQPAEPKA